MTDPVQIIGADTLAATLRLASSRLDNLDRATDRTAELLKVRASGHAPVRTGVLARSLTATSTGDTAEVSSSLIYAPVQEYGSTARNVRAQPYARPALEDSEPIYEAFYLNEIDALLHTVRGA